MQELPPVLQERQQIVEEALRDHVSSAAAGGPPLYRMMQYQLHLVDKDGLEESGTTPDRFLGALCVEAFHSISRDAATPLVGLCGAAVELLRESIAVHEDMQVAEPHDAERPAVWWVWGPAQAINVGDGLHALARLALFRLREQGFSGEEVLAVVSDLDAMALRYYEGQYLELTYQERMDITEAQYVTMASSKRGALFAGAMTVGARAAGAAQATVDALGSFGEHLGLAVQLKEDARLIWGGTSEGVGRLLNKSKLYPVVRALETAPVARKRALGSIYFKRVMESADRDEVRAILDEVGVREHTYAQMQAYAEQALGMLKTAEISSGAVERWESLVGALIGDEHGYY